jgi:large subunit ribosomal protein L21
MAFAVIKTGGKQYKVEPGQTIKIEKLTPAEGAKTVAFEEVLLVDDGSTTKLGKDLTGAKITAEIVSEGLAKKC